MKKIFLSLLFTVCCAVSSFAQFGNFDVNVRYDVFGYTVPLSLNGDALFLPENYHSENRTWFVPLESQVAVLDFEKVGVGFLMNYNFYAETDDVFAFSISPGISATWKKDSLHPLQGLTVSLFPLYGIPVYKTENFGNNLHPYKTVLEIAYSQNFYFLSFYPYLRNKFVWDSDSVKYGLEFGISIGIYFSRNYFEEVIGRGKIYKEYKESTKS